jgi:TolB-like protein
MNTPVIIYEFGDFSLNAPERLLLREGQAVALKPKVLDLLLILVQNSGHIIEKDVLIKQVWPDSFVEESNLTVNISVLRKVLGKSKDGKAYIENISKRGYRFVAKVIVSEPAPHQLTIHTNGKHQEHSGRTSIAVLPFKHIGSSENDEYLGLGITDALITRLSNVQQVIVRPTNAIRKYKDVLDPITAGQELKVETVLDGSIRRSGQRIRVTVQLVSVADGASLWAEKFDEQFTDIFDVEDSISEQVTKALMLRLSSEEKEQLVKHHTRDAKAYQAYLRGQYCCDKRTKDSLEKAIAYFQQAIDIDSNFALAYFGLAYCYILISSFNTLPPKECLPKSEKAILKALQLDNTLAEAHALLNQTARAWHTQAALSRCCFFNSCTAASTSTV